MKAALELKLFLAYLSLITAAEVITSLVNASVGLFMHSMLLFSLLALSSYLQKTVNASNVFLCLSIAPLIRVFSLALPLAYFPSYMWYLLAGIPMLIAAVAMMRIQGLKPGDIGINLKRPAVQILIMFSGIPFGIAEYLILRPAPISLGFSTLDFLLIALAFVLATGFAEELVFRGIFQNVAIKSFGVKTGLLVVSAVFAALHIGWLNILDVGLVFFIGLFFGVLMFKTGSLIGVSLSHGLTNVFLFLVMPSSINLISILTPK